MKNKILFSAFLCVIFFSLAVVLKTKISHAATPDLKGWLWGGSEDSGMAGAIGVVDGNEVGVGFISFNSSNCDSDSNSFLDVSCGGNNSSTPVGAAYAVNIPNGEGNPVTGFAWSENMGWIDFNPQNHCTIGVPDPAQQQYKALSCTPPSGSAGVFTASSNSLVGWARFVGIAQETAIGNAGGPGVEGWIRIFSSSDPAPQNSYVVSSDSNGNLTGYGWSELGVISFSGLAPTPPVVNLELSEPLSPVLLLDTETLASVGPKASLNWEMATGDMASCSKTCLDSSNNSLSCPDWENATFSSINEGSSGTVVNIPMPANVTKFVLKCTGVNGLDSNIAIKTVEVGCTNKSCSSQKCEYDMPAFIATDNGSDCPDSGNACSIDDECEERPTGEWKEVSP